MKTLTLNCPAKLNLFLAVTGRRPDGFHSLVSLVAPVAWGDTLTVTEKADPEWTLQCEDPEVPADGTNLVIKAAEAFRAATGWKGRAHFDLVKRIPHGAGLGGGSSDAASALKALNTIAGEPLTAAKLSEVAASVGSDCPLFLAGEPVIMRGRGEHVETLASAVKAKLAGRRVMIFKPGFGISTPWSYGWMIRHPQKYADEAATELRWKEWCASDDGPEALPGNTLEKPAFEKFATLPVLLKELRERFGVDVRMSGSGSACFLWLKNESPVIEIESLIRRCWGERTFLVNTEL